MRLRILQFTSAFAFLFGDLAPLRAQVVADGATNTLSNTTNNFASVTIGTNGSFTLLTLSNNALLTNSGNGTIGLNVTAKSNEVRLVSASARWRMGNNFFVGSNGAFSRLVISNGALVENFDGILANGLASSNNIAFVTGGGSTWSNRGDLTVGFSGRENQLIVTNGGRVGNRFGYLGRQPGSSNNVARVSGSGSVWTNQFDLTVGANDRSNRLIIEAGGFVTCANGVVSGSSSSGNNEVLVTGPGSVWSNQFLFMGDVAGRNRLVVSNGATLWSGVSILGSLSLALSNQVIVTGPGSVWTNESSLSLAESSPGNRVDVSDGGRLECIDGLLGQTLAANSNAVLLTGNGSAWNNRASLIVGNNGSGNTLTASNGAIITASNLIIGVTANAAGNRVTVDGGALRVTNAAGAGVLEVRRGAVSLRAGAVDVDRLVMTNVAGGFDLAGGTLITRGAAISNISGFTVSGSTTNPAIWDVRAGPGIHALGATLSVGGSLPFNQMLITNGGTLMSDVAYIGSNPGSSSNLALVSGVGSKWTAASIDVGNGGAFNRLIVSGGATVEDFNGALGQNSGSSNNFAVVTGSGSLWTNRNEMYVGYQGGGNQLVISNGGTAFAVATRFLGHAGGDVSNNTAIVTGPGSRWLGPGNLEVGGPAAFCRLLVTEGGLVANNFGFIGSGSTASNNLAMIAGAGSTWSNATDLYVGYSGVGNQLVVSNGASLRNKIGYLGFNASSSSNLAVITGSGSVWSNAGLLAIGNSGRGNALVVSNSAVVQDTSGYVGLDSIGNNLAVVTGPGSLWTNSSDVFVGTFGAGNRLVVNDGGEVRSGNGFVGIDASASNNLALVSGSGSVWSNALELYVGYSASGNQLVVSNGAAVFSANKGFIGYNSTAISNSAIVTGAGSRWMGGVLSDFYIGSNSSFNRLIITNGGLVTGNGGYLGHEILGRSNLVIVTGTGSLWSNRTSILEMGQRGSGNRLVISNGGSVFASFVRIGRISSGVGNEVVVTGTGSSLIGASFSLRVGETGSGNRLEINNGASVVSRFGEIGADTGSNNQVVVTGPGSLWTNAETFAVGRYGNRNRLIVSNAATFFSGERLNIGEETIGTNNQVVVDGGVLLVTNALGGAILEVRRGTNLFNAGLMEVDQLLITNVLGKFRFNGGTLITHGAFIRNGDNFEVGATGGNPAIWNVRDGMSTTFLDETIIVGGNASFNQLVLTNGNVLTNSGFADIGRDIGANSNHAVLSGVGSQWLLGDGVIVGRAGSGNRLSLSNGAVLVTASISYLGFNATSSNNEAVVTGPGTSWTTANYGLRVGNQGYNNRLVVSDGGMVSSFDDWIGVNSSSSNNQVLVTGSGSLWNNTRELAVGLNSSGNQLVVSNGGTVLTVANKYVGQNDGAFSNTAIITDPGSAWLGNDSLYVGSDGSLNQLFVRNGARVTSGIATLGGLAAADGNQALVTDSGSSWTNQLDLNVGEGGSGNRLTISNAATLASLSSGFIGRNVTAISNTVLLTDAGTRWLIASNLFVGSNGPFSRLVVSSGARLQNNVGAIGGGPSSSNNAVMVTGAGSVWSNANSLELGVRGKANQLVVSNGALVYSVGGFLGGNTTSSTSNEAVVTGAGSFWRSSGSLFVGSASSGNRLVVSNGGWMRNSTANIGGLGEDNEVTVTGAGSTWTNGGTLIVGASGRRSRLVVSDGGVVHEPFDLRMGENATSTNNRIVVDGGTLVMASPSSGLFDVRRGTNVLNAGLIYVGRVLLVTNTLGVFEFNGGTLETGGTVHSNGGVFTVGNGVSAATLRLLGGLHGFANNLIITSNATVTGDGTVTGVLTIQPGGRLSPGFPVGNLVLSNAPSLQGTTILEIGNNGATYNDQIQVLGPLTYGGSLVVTNIDFQALVVGNRFTLFNATSYSGAFTSIILPPLPATLRWTNMLAVDGSLEVVPYVPPAVGLTIQLANGSLQVSWPTNGADYCLETSYDLSPPITWQTVSSGITTNGASFVFTLANVSKSPKQFFRLAFPCSPTPLSLSLQFSNNLVTVSWPSNEFRLETTFDLTPPATWQNVSSGISNIGGLRSFSFTNSPVISKQFFRLAFP